MKKLFILILAILMLGGCGKTSSSPVEKHVTGEKFVYFYTDPKTNVEYVLYANSYGAGICPRYNADGTLYVRDSE